MSIPTIPGNMAIFRRPTPPSNRREITVRGITTGGFRDLGIGTETATVVVVPSGLATVTEFAEPIVKEGDSGGQITRPPTRSSTSPGWMPLRSAGPPE